MVNFLSVSARAEALLAQLGGPEQLWSELLL